MAVEGIGASHSVRPSSCLTVTYVWKSFFHDQVDMGVGVMFGLAMMLGVPNILDQPSPAPRGIGGLTVTSLEVV